ncbi:MAG: hypothetical protein ACR2L9_07770 [Solirubrobacteraceae bacterium]
MPSRPKKLKRVSLNPADLAGITKASPYIQRLVEDEKLRENVRTLLDSSRSAYTRLSNGKAPAKSLLEDKKLQRDLRQVLEAAQYAGVALSDAPKKRTRRKGGIRRKLMLLLVGGALALAVSEKLRSKVLDTLFGAEEEFQYTPPADTGAASTPSTPVSAA